MDKIIMLPTIVFLLVISILSLRQTRRRSKNLPPSPPSLPIIGHLHILKDPLHKTLQNLSTKHGPIYSLSVGVRNVVVVSSPSLVEECFTKNDIVLANRTKTIAAEILNYNHTTLASAPYGPHWRNLRRLAAVELFSTARLDSFLDIRREEVRLLIRDLFDTVSGCSGSLCKVEMKWRLFGLSANMVMRMVAGKRYSRKEGEEVQDLIRELFEAGGGSNPADFFPVLRWVDFMGMEKRMWRARAKADAFCQGLVDEHRNDRKEVHGDRKKTMIDTLLSLQDSDPETYTNDIIKGQVLTMMLAGTDTSGATMEWAMSLLVNNPDIMNKARAEIDSVIGNNRLVDESDYPNLPYLQNIIKETLRLFPVAPLLVPHHSSEDCMVGGYLVSKNTMILVNAWAIHRDPTVWDNPTTFRPERHQGGSEGYKLVPFGMGRRACPGTVLANRVVGLVLGGLIQCFEWELIGGELLDMAEGQGLTMHKVVPLEVMCKPRECMMDVLMTA
ncbi:Cytochrome P450 81Q32 [Linum grandiflorum]